jgi:2-oxoglutarate dehydrogenase E2 component (dihydrolipoamide succinyltransferase)
MTTKVTVPQLGESVVEATVGKWLVEEGQQVKKDQPLVEIMTDKADSEVPSPAAGVLVNVTKGEDETVAVGDTLCEIDESAEASASQEIDEGAQKSEDDDRASQTASERSSSKASRERSERREADVSQESEGGEPSGPTSPSVRQLAREKGVDLSEVRGTGKDARITRDDVLRAAGEASPSEESGAPAEYPEEDAAQREARAAEPQPSRPAQRPPPRPSEGGTAPPTGPLGAFKLPPYVPQEGDEVIPFTRRRRIIADHMLYSKHTAPDVVTFAECDLQETAKIRSRLKREARRGDIVPSYLAFTAAATCRALREFPDINARVLDDAYVRLQDVNLGIAVDTEQGLIVPVIPRSDELTVRGLARAIDDVAAKARDGKLSPDDLANKTFTISNPGRKGNLVGGAIISQPNVAILRMGTIKKRVVVVEKDGEDLMAIHPVMQMALTYDHRIVDGVNANGFLFRVAELLETGDFEV